MPTYAGNCKNAFGRHGNGNVFGMEMIMRMITVCVSSVTLLHIKSSADIPINDSRIGGIGKIKGVLKD